MTAHHRVALQVSVNNNIMKNKRTKKRRTSDNDAHEGLADDRHCILPPHQPSLSKTSGRCLKHHKCGGGQHPRAGGGGELVVEARWKGGQEGMRA